jgi:hypothetical protein
MFKDRIDRLKGLKLTDQAAAKISKTFDTVDFEGEVKQEKWKKVKWVEKWGVTKASIKRGRIEMMAHRRQLLSNRLNPSRVKEVN